MSHRTDIAWRRNLNLDPDELGGNRILLCITRMELRVANGGGDGADDGIRENEDEDEENDDLVSDFSAEDDLGSEVGNEFEQDWIPGSEAGNDWSQGSVGNEQPVVDRNDGWDTDYNVGPGANGDTIGNEPVEGTEPRNLAQPDDTAISDQLSQHEQRHSEQPAETDPWKSLYIW